ncbi:hypothetical protein [Burkholderia stagnalis]|uniref:hypothetical protein n=1 Tax=Burkholderia stagnalis TaxID=1503054 RepID=UPI000F5CC177|nr:hypothetical protein [Burkholderia stagnalis]RQY25351.1 hypothetical protein DF117_05880 [Burkholderia stagnalis]RQZ01492.1 hypothetical protein DF106_04250 [Burkholderia stagnalis]RQZ07069.1 hypothetical protein DF105_06590 [Burkholderia stagnalis]
MVDIEQSFIDAQLDAHLVCDLLRVLYSAVPADKPDGLPIHGTLKHILKLAEALPDAIDMISREVCHG